jgi:hypothetical protein
MAECHARLRIGEWLRILIQDVDVAPTQIADGIAADRLAYDQERLHVLDHFAAV